MTVLFFSLLIINFVFSSDVYGSDVRKLDRIVGGRKVSVNIIPYQAQLLQNNIQICGATILSPTWILTAAHCIDKSSPKWTILTGSDDASAGGDNHEIKGDPYVHPNYNRDTTDNDIALLELVKPININERQKSIPIAIKHPKAGDKVTVSGFGKLGEHDDYSDKLMVAMVPVIDEKVCSEKYHPEPITDNMFCAGTGERDTCQGDSGGPAVINNELVGVVSFGKICASPEHPGVYTKVAKYIEWIILTTQSSEHKVPQKNPLSIGTQQQINQSFSWLPISQQLTGSIGQSHYSPTYDKESRKSDENRYGSQSILGSILTGKVHITFSK